MRSCRCLKDRFQPFTLNQVEQLQGRAAGLLVADLPFLDRGDTGIQYRGEHGLAEPSILSKRFILLRRNRMHVEFVLVDVRPIVLGEAVAK